MTKRISYAQYVVLSIVLISLGVTPFFSYDPINVSRFFFLAIFGMSIGSILIVNACSNSIRKFKLIFVLNIAFIVWSLTSLIFSKRNLTEGFFGVSGRQTGFITYSCLALILLGSLYFTSENFVKSLTFAMVYIGLVFAIYGIIQKIGYDPFNWINPYSPVFGLLGNPNFHSAFMGIWGSVAFVLLVAPNNKKLYIVFYSLLLTLAFFNIYWSESQQGFLVLASGCAVAIIFYSRNRYSPRVVFVTSLFIGIFSVTAIILDILQKSPWKSKLYEDSISFRGDFWRSAWNMALDHPFFGVGLDGFRDNYKLYRDSTAYSRSIEGLPVDSAHNLFLDILIGGGFPLLIIHLVNLSLVLISLYKLFFRKDKLNVFIIAISSAWFAFTTQSLISINQIGIAIWGWVIAGAIIGLEMKTREGNLPIPLPKMHPKTKPSFIIGLIFGITLGLPQLYADASFRSSFASGKVEQIEASLNLWPKSVTRMNITSKIFREANLNRESLRIAENALKFNPANYEAWKEYSLQRNISENERKEAQRRLTALNSPYVRP